MEALQALCDKFTPLGIDKQKIVDRFSRYVDEFAIPEDEALRTLSIDFNRELGIVDASGSLSQNYQADFVKISDINTNLIDCDCRGQILSLEIPNSQKLSYAGIIGDETGSIRFVISRALNGTGKDIPEKLEIGKSYAFYGAQVSDYNQQVSLFLGAFSAVHECDNIDAPLFNPEDIVNITPGVRDLHAVITRLDENKHEKIRCSGILADETATARFIVWQNGSDETLNLKPSRTYDISFASASLRDGKLNLDLTSAVIKPSAQAVEKPSDDRVTVSADVTRISKTEVVYRCPECRKLTTLVKDGYECKTHGIVSGPIKEFRTKCRIDNGVDVWSVTLNEPAVLEVLGMTRDELFAWRDDRPLGDGAVGYKVYDKLFGRRVTVRGFQFDGYRVVADRCCLAYPDATIAPSGQQEVSE